MRTVLAAFAAEFRMQRRRPAVWVVLAALGGLTLTVGIGLELNARTATPRPDAATAAAWAQLLNWWVPIGVAGLLADRVPRDRRTGVDELFAAVAGDRGPRLLGKYLGATAATLLPVGIVYGAGVALLVVDRGAAVLPAAAAAFLAVTLPGLLAAGALAVALPAVVPVPAFQLVFAGLWYWTAAPGIPGSPSGTVLDPLGTLAADGLFGARVGVHGPPDAVLLAANLAAVAALAAIPLFLLPRLAAQRAART